MVSGLGKQYIDRKGGRLVEGWVFERERERVSGLERDID